MEWMAPPAVDWYCWGAVFLYVVELVKIKKKRATRLSNNAVHDKNSFLS